MPLSKRVLEGCNAYTSNSEVLLEETSVSTVFSDVHMSNVLGALHQIGYMSSYCFEVLDDLVSLTDDARVRIALVAKRTDDIMYKLEEIEKDVYDDSRADHLNAGDEAEKRPYNTNSLFGREQQTALLSANEAKERFLGDRESFIPEVLTQNTNCRQVKAAFDVASPPPQLWKMESVTAQDCMSSYSDPGYFFTEWLRVEQEGQAMRVAEKKREKNAKKLLKLQRRQQRVKDQMKQRKSILDLAPAKAAKKEKKSKKSAPAEEEKKAKKKDSAKSDQKEKAKAKKKKRTKAEVVEDEDESDRDEASSEKRSEKNSAKASMKGSEDASEEASEANESASDGHSSASEEESQATAEEAAPVAKAKDDSNPVLDAKSLAKSSRGAQGLFQSVDSGGAESSDIGEAPPAIEAPQPAPKKTGFFSSLFGAAKETPPVASPEKEKLALSTNAQKGEEVDFEEAGMSSMQLARARAKAARVKAQKVKGKQNIFDDIITDMPKALVSIDEDSQSGDSEKESEKMSEAKGPENKASKRLSKFVADSDSDANDASSSSEEEKSESEEESSAASQTSEEESEEQEDASSSEEEDESAAETKSSRSDTSEASSVGVTRRPKSIAVPDRRRSSASTAVPTPPKTLLPVPPPPGGGRPPPPGPPGGGARPPPPGPPTSAGAPPPPPAPFRPRLGSALGNALRGNLNQTAALKKVVVEQKVDSRLNLLASIKTGGGSLKMVGRPSMQEGGSSCKKKSKPTQNTAIAAILSNRSKIAGGNSSSEDEGDDSDSDYSF